MVWWLKTRADRRGRNARNRNGTRKNALGKRLAALEAARIAPLVRLSPEEREEAARGYEATLYEDDPVSPQAEAYFATASLHQLASDYYAMLKGALAPWD